VSNNTRAALSVGCHIGVDVYEKRRASLLPTLRQGGLCECGYCEVVEAEKEQESE
jgi:hypothetical protein